MVDSIFDGNLLLKSVNNSTADLSISRNDAATSDYSDKGKTLAQIRMFGSGLNNSQGVLSFETINNGSLDGPLEGRLMIHTNGFVGIGTDAPKNKLDVEGAAVIGEAYSGNNSAPTNGLLVEGNVGLGVAVPSEKLEINGSIRGNQSGALRISTGNGYVDIGPQNTGWSHFQTDRQRYYFDKEVRVDSGMIGSYDEDLSLLTSGIERIRINRWDGNVGIGTTEPKASLHVNGTGDFLLKVSGTNDRSWAGIQIINSSVYSYLQASSMGDLAVLGTNRGLIIRTNENERLRITSEGNVGIGTTSPTQGRLVVAGGSLALDTTSHAVVDLGANNRFRICGPNGSCQTAGEYIGGRIRLSADGSFANAEGQPDPGMGGIMAPGNVVVGGSMRVNGVISAKKFSGGVKFFIIDHPLDPEHKNLKHASLEGPEIAVYYRGEGELSNGSTTIELPDYFESLTRRENRTVLITPKFENSESISMLAASEVYQGRFSVKMIDRKNPAQKFYWEVNAVRSDVKELEVEETKSMG